jgi:hypothetical protein
MSVGRKFVSYNVFHSNISFISHILNLFIYLFFIFSRVCVFVYRVGKTETIYLSSVLFINPVVYIYVCACVCNSNILQKGEGVE